MASNQSNTGKRPAASETPKDALTAVARNGARIQIAALTAAGTVVTGWARAATRLVQAVGDELLRRVDGETDSGELVVHLAAAANAHLRELTALPGEAVNHFDTRLSRGSIDN